MTYNILFADIAKRQFEKLDKHVQNRILSSLERIKVRPYNFVKKLSGYPYFRFRVGDYRLILDIRNNDMIIIVIEVGYRKNIYKI